MRSKWIGAFVALLAIALPFLGSAQTFPTTVSFGPTTLTGTGAVGTINLSGQSTCSASIQGTGTWTVTPQVTQDNVNYVTVAGSTPSGSQLSSITNAQTLSFPIPSYYGFRLNVSSFVSGAVTISGTCSGASSNTQIVTVAGGSMSVTFPSPQPVTIATALPAGGNTIGAVTFPSPQPVTLATQLPIGSNTIGAVTFPSPQPVTVATQLPTGSNTIGAVTFPTPQPVYDRQTSAGLVISSIPDSIISVTTTSSLTTLIAGTTGKSLRLWSASANINPNTLDDAVILSVGTGTNCATTNTEIWRLQGSATTTSIYGEINFYGVALASGAQVCVKDSNGSDDGWITVVYSAAY